MQAPVTHDLRVKSRCKHQILLNSNNTIVRRQTAQHCYVRPNRFNHGRTNENCGKRSTSYTFNGNVGLKTIYLTAKGVAQMRESMTPSNGCALSPMSFASSIIPAQVPQTAIFSARIRCRMGSNKSKITISLPMVVLSPPGIMSPCRSSRSFWQLYLLSVYAQFAQRIDVLANVALDRQHTDIHLVLYHPRTASSSSLGIERTSMPDIGSPRPRETSATI